MGTFLGMRTTADFVSNEDPQNWRRGILELNPNGSAPLTAMLSLAETETLQNTTHNWWTRTMSAQSGAVTSIYIDAALGTEYVYGSHQATYGISGATVYAKCAEAVAELFVAGKQVLLADADRSDVDLVGKVTGVVKNGANSYLSIKLMEADDNSASSASYNLGTVDRIINIGSINPQGGYRPDAVTFEPTQISNYTHIHRTPIDLSRTAINTTLRTRDPYQDALDQALLYHGAELERNLILSIADNTSVGSNGKPEWSSMGLRSFIKTYASANVADYTLDTAFSGQTWKTGGIDYLDAITTNIFAYTPDQPGNYGDGTRIAFVGPSAMLGITQAVRASATYNIEKGEIGYGIKIRMLMTPAGDLILKLHPLFTLESRFAYSMLVVEPRNIRFMPLQNSDTHLVTDAGEAKGQQTTSATGKDGIDQEWLTECTYEFNFPETMGWYDGIGRDNNLS